jgi:Helix-turn-helix domain
MLSSLTFVSLRRRAKVFGPGRAVPLDRNAKARIAAYARAWSARNRQPRQHRGPITRAFLDVLGARLWGFHNSRTGCCFPSYERIAEVAECARSTVAEALKALEWAGVLTWQNRITRILLRERDLFGQWASRWQVIRTSNAYVFRDPLPQLPSGFPCKSENPPGTQNQEVLTVPVTRTPDPNRPLERALRRLGAGIEERLLLNGSSGTVGAI